jgi:O-antigen/teichoic acid export membrane protein
MSNIQFAACLLAVAIPLMWAKKAPRLVPWLLLFGGVGLADVVLNLIGPITWTILGITVALPLTIALGVLFWLMVVKKHKPHRVRTPLVAFALGVMLLGLGGGIGHMISGLFTSISAKVSSQTGQLINSNGR